MCSPPPAFVLGPLLRCWGQLDNGSPPVSTQRLSAFYECAQRKINEILIQEGKRKLVPWHCFCVLLDVNGEHIVLGHNGILRSRTEAMMDCFLSLLHKVTNPEINNIELLQRIFPLFGLDEDSFICSAMPFVIVLPPFSPQWQQSNTFRDKCPHCCCWPVEDCGQREILSPLRDICSFFCLFQYWRLLLKQRQLFVFVLLKKLTQINGKQRFYLLSASDTIPHLLHRQMSNSRNKKPESQYRQKSSC